jgi:hypothetical protein
MFLKKEKVYQDLACDHYEITLKLYLDSQIISELTELKSTYNF